MTEHQSIYQQPRPVSAQRHAEWHITDDQDYRFAMNLNAVPLVTSEFAAAAIEYPIVFADSDSGLLPLALLGLRDGENLFVTPDGRWDGHYVPALFRQYPFGFAQVGDEKQAMLCIDEASPLCNHEGTGSALFGADGNGTDYLNRMANMVKEVERARQATLHFGRRLLSLDLLDSRQMKFNETDGQGAAIRGFSIIDRERLRQLPAETAGELLSSGALELIHAHLISLGCRERLMQRLSPRQTSQDLH